MSKKPLFMIGITILLIAIIYGSSLLITSLRARSADTSNIETGGGGGGDRNWCGRENFEIAEVSPSDRVISDKDSLAITAVLSNKGSEDCDIMLSLTAPTFDVDPAEKQLVVLKPGLRTETFIWLLVPKKQGSFQARLSADLDNSSTLHQLIGLTVTDVLGFTPRWAKVISILGTFVGSTFTLPKLMEWYQEWKKKREKQVPEKRKPKNKKK
jgi:hypothetical protein